MLRLGFSFLAVCTLVLACSLSEAGTISVSSTVPTIDGDDIANLANPGPGAGAFDPGGNEGHIWHNRPIQGQTFTTLGNPGGYRLSSVTLQNEENTINNNGSPFTVRIGEISGNTFTERAREDSTNSISYVPDDFMTFNFSTPVALSPNTVYGFEWDASGSGFTTWNNADTNYAGGTGYSSGSGGVPNDSNLVFRNIDRVFHVDLAPSGRELVGRLGVTGNRVSGAAYELNTTAGTSTGAPVDWKLEVLQETVSAGLATEWHHGEGDVGLAGIDTFFATHTPTIPVFQSPQVAFAPPPTFTYPPEVVAAGLDTGTQRTVRYTGQIYIPETGEYKFKDGVDQTTRLIIDGQTVIADSQWAGFDGSGGDGGGSLIQTATFSVASGGEWLPFEFVMSENCCGTQASLYWDYNDLDDSFPTARNVPASLNDLIAPEYFRTLEITVGDTLMGTGQLGDVLSGALFADAGGNMLTLPLNVPTTVRLTVSLEGLPTFTLTEVLTATIIPEPATLVIWTLLAGLGIAANWRRRRR